jgi:hypothetical protein
MYKFICLKTDLIGVALGSSNLSFNWLPDFKIAGIPVALEQIMEINKWLGENPAVLGALFLLPRVPSCPATERRP